MQLDLEQYALSDVCAAFFLLTALVVLVWRGRQAGWATMTTSGLLLGAAAVTRAADLVLIVPAALYLAVTIRPWRRVAACVCILAAGFLLPVAAYAGWFASAHGQWGVTSYNGTFLYGRVVPFAGCAGLPLPSYEGTLCPAQPPAQRNYDFYMWSAKSPQWRLQPPHGMTRQAVVLDFSRRVLAHQPLSYLAAVGTDMAYGFSPVRGNGPEHYPAAYLKFQAGFPPYAEVQTALGTYGRSGPAVQPELAAFLAGYGRFCYVPGVILGAGLLAGLASLAGFRRSRRGSLCGADLLFTAATAAALASASAFAPFDWRYQLPQLTLIPVVAILGITVLSGWRSPAPGAGPRVPSATVPSRSDRG